MLDEQVGLLTLLKEFDCICRKHNITYYLEGGSLLGAVRHKGFLPWDDDVDLCITRDNWKKLLQVIDRSLPKNREIYSYERYPEYLRETVKYTNLDSTVIFPNHILDGLACGQHIDLFILDPAPSDPAEQEEYKALACIYSELMTPVYVMCDDILKYEAEYNKYRHLMKRKGREYVLELLREKLYAYEDNENCQTYYLRWGNRHRFFDKAYFGTPVEVEFEGGFYPAPQQYHRFLRAEFGDTWMMIPETKNQEVHDTYDNYHIPCHVFMEDYKSFINYREMAADYAQRKRLNIRKLKIKKAIEKDKAAKRQILFDLTLQDIIHALPAEAAELLAAHQYQTLNELLAPYTQAQLRSELLQHGLAIHVCEEVLYVATLSLVMTGRFPDAERLLTVNEQAGRPLSDRLCTLGRLITDVRACMLADEEQRYADATALADAWAEEYPLQLNLAVYRLQQAARDGKDAEDILKAAENLLSYYPETDSLLLLMGDQLIRLGRDAEAQGWYRRCGAVTRNGLIRMALPAYALEPAEESEASLSINNEK